MVELIPSGLGYCALNLNWREVNENMIFYSELNDDDQAYKYMKYKRLVLTKLINFYLFKIKVEFLFLL